MSQIDPTRLSRVLASLSKPKERAGSAITPPALGRGQGNTKDSAVLRARLHERLIGLKQHQERFHETASIITIQEILRWEFGESILEHAEFERVAQKVTATMLKDQQLQGAIRRIVEDALSAGKDC